MKISAGLLVYRITDAGTEFFLVHPGGAFFAKKDAGWWTVPKGEIEEGEEPLAAAIREFKEETGYTLTQPFIPLLPVVQKGGKKVLCWAVEDNVCIDASAITCNTFEMVWPPKSGRVQQFPEIDKAGWFAYNDAVRLINERQVSFLDEVNIMTQKSTDNNTGASGLF
ncbi:NUDIX domain-containing protein [Flavobacterium rhizosphaerae]|uniref:NUDIX domain-containing protein n=1 Tax=Flavobacterium rhizosphaerae TaxID=3163298 RepID=A0ABW8YUA1_9FLAO